MSAPAPLVSAEVDLRGMEFMPLYGDRLVGSETWIRASAEGKVAALRLWWRAYAHELPASSLPNDDKLLAEYAGYGVGIKLWLKIKPEVMRRWVLCSDGRWYHPIVAELALKAWALRLRDREKQRRWRDRNQSKDGDITPRVTVASPAKQPVCHAGEGEGQDRDRTVTSKEEPPAMSGKPDDAPLNGTKSKALEVLEFLNAKTGRNYQAVEANTKLITARLREGATVDDCRAVIAKKFRDWSGDDKMREFLRPATLFNATKFAQYRGEVGDGGQRPA